MLGGLLSGVPAGYRGAVAARVILFDLNGTLTDPRPLGGPWEAPDLGVQALERAVQSAMVDTILGRFRDFSEHIESGLRTVVRGRGLDEGGVTEAMRIATALPPFSDAEVALGALVDAGHRLAVLTNSGADAGRRTIEAAGMVSRFERILGVDAVKAFKPHPATYRYALEELGCGAGEVTFVAAHPWDLAGAADAGMRTALIARGEVPPPVYPRADVEAPDLSALAAALG
jgi:2-haloacid dehalogenase